MVDVHIKEARSEHEDQYDAALRGDVSGLRDAIVNDKLREIEPAEPILCTTDTTVRQAIERIRDHADHQGAVCVVDDAGKLIGIFSERDLMNRVLNENLTADQTTVGEVMTRSPIALTASDKIADALHLMAVHGFRNIPIVQDEKPIGIVFTRHFVKFIVSLFPELTLNRNIRGLKSPGVMDGG